MFSSEFRRGIGHLSRETGQPSRLGAEGQRGVILPLWLLTKSCGSLLCSPYLGDLAKYSGTCLISGLQTPWSKASEISCVFKVEHIKICLQGILLSTQTCGTSCTSSYLLVPPLAAHPAHCFGCSIFGFLSNAPLCECTHLCSEAAFF